MEYKKNKQTNKKTKKTKNANLLDGRQYTKSTN